MRAHTRRWDGVLEDLHQSNAIESAHILTLETMSSGFPKAYFDVRKARYVTT